jgi:UDP-N-acetylmuramyl tripeptide synthase
MGCVSSKAAAAVERQHAKEESMLGPPSKIMDASEHAQYVLMMVRKTIEQHLGVFELDKLKATQMITRTVGNNGDDGTMYYIKAKVNSDLTKCTYVFVKIYEPSTLTVTTGVSPVTFKAMKEMDQDYELVTF